MADRITWYDILGISPGSSSESVRRAYQDKVTQLEHDRIADAPPEVAAAATRGREVLDAAWLALGNPAERQRYDEQIGISGKGAGLDRTEPARRGQAFRILRLPSSIQEMCCWEDSIQQMCWEDSARRWRDSAR